jgi:hypothetical protein
MLCKSLMSDPGIEQPKQLLQLTSADLDHLPIDIDSDDNDLLLNEIIDVAHDWICWDNYNQGEYPLLPNRVFREEVLPLPPPVEEPSPQKHSSEEVSCAEPLTERFNTHQTGKWSIMYEELVQYRATTGHCNVPHFYQENLALARWVKRQRYQYKLMLEGKVSTMASERVDILESIGFCWDSQGNAWFERFRDLQEYLGIFKHCNVPSNYKANPQLATWVKCQRRQMKFRKQGEPSSMSPYRQQELVQLGFEWELRCSKKGRRC